MIAVAALAPRTTLLRVLVGSFCWMTAAYAFVSASPFVYRQFLAPRVFHWLGTFSDWHAVIYWGWLALALVSLWHFWAARGTVARAMAIAFAGSGVLLGIYLIARPVLPTLVDDRRSLLVGVVALVPMLWLAAIDYVDLCCNVDDPVALPGALRREALDHHGHDDARLFVAAIGTAVFVVIASACLTPIAMMGQFEPDLLTMGLAVGLGWNLIEHLLIFCGAFLILAVIDRAIGAWRFSTRYAVALLLFALVIALIVQRTVCDALGFSGWSSALAAGTFAASIATTWGALRLRRWSRRAADIRSPWDLLFGPPPRDEKAAYRLAPLLALSAAAYGIGAVSRIVDWDFLLLTCGVCALWIAAFDQILRLAPRDLRIGGLAMTVICGTPLALFGLASSESAAVVMPRHSLDRYAVYNPSFRVADRFLRDATVAGDDSFQRFLRANTGLTGEVEASPASVDLVPPPQLTPRESPPLIFLFVIDSLRRDYLQPYNHAVDFTPSLAQFGAESLVFRHTFTAYGGTGLSVPAIWSGSVGVHKQYVMPFAPMNALGKLLDVNGYRQFLSVDSIIGQIIPRSPSMTALDAGRPNEDFAFCGTVAELEGKLEASAGDARPVFAYSLPQDLHISNIIGASVPPGESYPGFQAPYAARVHRIDGCFGDFIRFLKRHAWYDRSLIVVTADHGEMLGEDGLWGHVYYLHPPVVEVPLIVHLPARVDVAADLDAVSLTTDITPTVYAALGYDPRASSGLVGRALVGPPGTDFTATRRTSYVLAASYSAVYATLGSEGRRLYIVDAVQHRQYGYERQDGGWAAMPITAGIREVGRRLIRQHVYEINQVYQVKAPQ